MERKKKQEGTEQSNLPIRKYKRRLRQRQQRAPHGRLGVEEKPRRNKQDTTQHNRDHSVHTYSHTQRERERDHHLFPRQTHKKKKKTKRNTTEKASTTYAHWPAQNSVLQSQNERKQASRPLVIPTMAPLDSLGVTADNNDCDCTAQEDTLSRQQEFARRIRKVRSLDFGRMVMAMRRETHHDPNRDDNQDGTVLKQPPVGASRFSLDAQKGQYPIRYGHAIHHCLVSFVPSFVRSFSTWLSITLHSIIVAVMAKHSNNNNNDAPAKNSPTQCSLICTALPSSPDGQTNMRTRYKADHHATTPSIARQ